MPITIPDSVFDKYFDVVDSTFNIFGVTCQLVYIEKVEEISSVYDNIPDNRSVNAHRRSQPLYTRQDKVIKEVEKTEDIKLKVYWDSKSWTKVGAEMVIPDNSVQTIFFASDLDKIMRAKELIVHKEIKDLIEMRFKKFGEPFPMGLKQNRYYGCFWERSS
tara:strand:+ start:393 stop:875 length:483 start_codon:yes stop_codon:yes gene_type:complete